MARKRGRSSHWLNNEWWKFAIGEWIALTLTFLTLVLLFCLFFIRRHTIDYRFEHTFTVRSPEFIGSALAIASPVLLGGNKIELLQNGDEYFPAMLKAIQEAKKTINFEAFILYSDEVGLRFRDALCDLARGGIEVRVMLEDTGSGWQLNTPDFRVMKEPGSKFAYSHPTHSCRVARTNRRSHRRILVTDGKLGFTG